MKEGNLPNDFFKAMAGATRALKKHNTETACALIAGAMALRMDAPHPHNLLGILNELKGDDNAARRHYRAAYALDPTFKPACRNLERLVLFEWGMQRRAFDYGEGPEEGNTPTTE